MNPFKHMVNYLQTHPIIGSISSIGGAVIASATSVLTADTTVRLIGIASLYVGFGVGILTGIIKLIELFRLIKKK